MGLFPPMQLQPGSSPDIPTPQMEREQLRSSQVPFMWSITSSRNRLSTASMTFPGQQPLSQHKHRRFVCSEGAMV